MQRDIEFEISSKAIDDFEADGVVHLPGVLSPSAVSSLANDIETLIGQIGSTPTGYDLEALGEAAYADAGVPNVGTAHQYDLDMMAGFLLAEQDRRLADETTPGAPKGAYFLDTGCWTRASFVRHLALNSVLPAIAAQLLNSSKIAFYDDQMFVKEPGTKQRTAFHQDYPFFHLRGDQGCVIWAPVDHVDETNGRLSYVRGSHLWDDDFAASMFISHTPMPGSKGNRVPDIEAAPENYDLISFNASPGDLVIHHFKTLHGAGGNRSIDRRRRAMSFRYVGDDMRYYWRAGAPFQPHHSHRLSDGDPLFCEDFPLVLDREPMPDCGVMEPEFSQQFAPV
jgi:hypothetical protein